MAGAILGSILCRITRNVVCGSSLARRSSRRRKDPVVDESRREVVPSNGASYPSVTRTGGKLRPGSCVAFESSDSFRKT
jgi:hypothetical protein